MRKNIYYLTIIVVGSFIALHLINHLISLKSVAHHLAMMDGLRNVYRQQLVESLLTLAILFQVWHSIGLLREGAYKEGDLYVRSGVWARVYLSVFILFHMSAVMFGRHILDLDTNFYFGAAGLNVFPFLLFFVPYYAFAIISVFMVIASWQYKRYHRRFLGSSAAFRFFAISLLGMLIAVMVLYGLTDGFKGVQIPDDYGIMVGR